MADYRQICVMLLKYWPFGNTGVKMLVFANIQYGSTNRDASPFPPPPKTQVSGCGGGGVSPVRAALHHHTALHSAVFMYILVFVVRRGLSGQTWPAIWYGYIKNPSMEDAAFYISFFSFIVPWRRVSI